MRVSGTTLANRGFVALDHAYGLCAGESTRRQTLRSVQRALQSATGALVESLFFPNLTPRQMPSQMRDAGARSTGLRYDSRKAIRLGADIGGSSPDIALTARTHLFGKC